MSKSLVVPSAQGGPGLGSRLRALRRLLLYVGLTLPLMPVQALALAFGWRLATKLPLWYHARCCRLLGFQVERRGRQSRAHPTLYAANHTSYFDIMILASLIEGSFVAKAEVARWPLFGQLARLQRTVFVDRNSRNTARHRNHILDRLQKGDDLVLFPEGTSSDGNRVLPFKSALFAVTEGWSGDRPLTLQPVSIAYTRLDGMPMGRYLRPFFAWYGDMDMAAHIWHAVALGWVTVTVQFHRPIAISGLESRKVLSEKIQREVAAGVAAALSGRRPAAGWAPSAPAEAGRP